MATLILRKPGRRMSGLTLPVAAAAVLLNAGAGVAGGASRGGLPEAFNWCDYGVCTPIKDQSACDCGWAFAVTGAFECRIAIEDGTLVDLSEEWLLSCTDAGDCYSGNSYEAASYNLCSGEYTDPCGGHGAVLESDFPYEASEVFCGCPYPHPYCLDAREYVEGSTPSVEALKQAIFDHGPVVAYVHANTAFEVYHGGVFHTCEDGPLNHAVVLVGWDDTQGTDGVWILRNSLSTHWGEDICGNPWGPDTDGGYMRIEYGCSRIGAYGLYLDYAGLPPALTFDYPDGRPERLTPGEATTFRVVVTGQYDGVPAPNSGRLHYALNGSEWESVLMTPTDPANEYEATLPAASCFDVYNWYVSAQEATEGYTFYDPNDAPQTSYSAIVATGEAVLFVDDFETDRGWEVYAGADTGNWERADPEEVIYLGGVTQPGDDHSPDGTLCYVTGPLAGDGAGDYDVDGGPTILTSPAFDLSGVDPAVSYWRWYHSSGASGDVLLVEVSNDGGVNWVEVEAVEDREEWTRVEWKVSDYVTPTDQVRVRFTADDTPNDSLIEALIDDFTITALVCVECPGDLDYDGDVDLSDLAQLLAHYGTAGGARYEHGDLDLDGDVDLSDLAALLAVYGTTCP
jgi:hypothetical protein